MEDPAPPRGRLDAAHLDPSSAVANGGHDGPARRSSRSRSRSRGRGGVGMSRSPSGRADVDRERADSQGGKRGVKRKVGTPNGHALDERAGSIPPPSGPSLSTPTSNGVVGTPTSSAVLPGSENAQGVQRVGAADTAVPNSDVAIARLPVRVAGSADKVGRGAECWSWADVPMNKQGFRYLACAPSPQTSPAPLVMPFYRTIPTAPAHSPVHLDWLDRSAFTKLSDDALSVTTEKGFRSARGNVAVQEGAWYFEAIIENGIPREGIVGGSGAAPTSGPHVRVGWARREASINGPAGADGYSYALRDATGEKVHLSRPRAHGRAFGTGDVVGCLISLPPKRAADPADPADPAHIKRKRVAIKYKGQLYFETVDYVVIKEMEELVGRDLKPGAVPPSAGEPNGAGAAQDGATSTPSKIKTKQSGEAKHGKAVKKGRKLKPDARAAAEAALPVARHLPRLPGSSIAFFLNGQPMAPEPAFTDLFSYLPLRAAGEAERAKSARKVYTAEAANKDRENPFDDGTLGYYPFFSVYGNGKVRFNPGPIWEAPVDDVQWGLGRDERGHVRPRAMSERWDELRVDERQWDERDEAEFVYKWEHGLRDEYAADAAAREKQEASESGTPAPNSKPSKDGKSRSKTKSGGSKKPISKGAVSALSGAHRRDSVASQSGRHSTPDASSVRSSPAPSQAAYAGASSPAVNGREESVPPPNPQRSWAPSRVASPDVGMDMLPAEEAPFDVPKARKPAASTKTKQANGRSSTGNSRQEPGHDAMAGWDPDVLASLSRAELRALKASMKLEREAAADGERNQVQASTETTQSPSRSAATLGDGEDVEMR